MNDFEERNPSSVHDRSCYILDNPLDHLFLDRSPNIGPLVSRWELDKFKNCWNKSFRPSKILTLLYQQLSNLLIFQRDMSGPWLRALSKHRWSGGTYSSSASLSNLPSTIKRILPIWGNLYHRLQMSRQNKKVGDISAITQSGLDSFFQKKPRSSPP